MNVRKLLVRRLRPFLAPRGYSRRGMDWYRHGSKTTTALFIRVGESCGQFHLVVQLARFDRSLHRETHPDIWAASETVGMSALVPDHEEWCQARSHLGWLNEWDADKFVHMIEIYALPRLVQLEKS